MKKTLLALSLAVAGLLVTESLRLRPFLVARPQAGDASNGSPTAETAAATRATPSAAARRLLHADAPAAQRVAALAYLEPRGRVVNLNAPAELAQERVARWRVVEGQSVRLGQPLVELEALDRLQRDVEVADSRVQLAQSHLAQILAGAREGERAAQRAELERLTQEQRGQLAALDEAVARARAELRLQQAEHERYRQLFKEGAAPASLLDQKRFAAESSRTSLAQVEAERDRVRRVLDAQRTQARANLRRVLEVRPTDVAAAQAEVAAARADAARARTMRSRCTVRAPQPGVLLKVLTRAGERVSPSGLAQLGDTQSMEAVAEVYDTQIQGVRLDQAVRLTGRNVAGLELRGRVVAVGKMVLRQSTFSNEPGEDFDRRIIEVRVRLDEASGRAVAGLTHLQLEALFE